MAISDRKLFKLGYITAKTSLFNKSLWDTAEKDSPGPVSRGAYWGLIRAKRDKVTVMLEGNK